MPRSNLFTRDKVISAALELTREGGLDAVTARTLGARLGTSSKPIFSLFESMDEVRAGVAQASEALYREYLRTDMEKGVYPPYKASGMAYIRFAREERELFRLLFMRERGRADTRERTEEIAPMIDLICKNTGLSREDAYVFHLEMWIYVHGIAAMIATSYLEWDMEFVSRALTDAYLGLKSRFCAKAGGDAE